MVLVTMSRKAAFAIELKMPFASAQLCTRSRNCSASFLRCSKAAGGDPFGTISTSGCILYSKLRSRVFRRPSRGRRRRRLSREICRLSLKRPRTRLPQTMSTLRRAFSVSGRTPWLSSDLVSWSGDSRIRCAMPGIGLVDLARARIDAELLAFLELHLFVDQLVDDFVALGLLVRWSGISAWCAARYRDW